MVHLSILHPDSQIPYCQCPAILPAWAKPVVVVTNVFPALFHCQVVVGVCPLKYSSITIRPFTRIIKDLVFFWIRKSFKGWTAL